MTQQISGFNSRFNSIGLKKLNHLTEKFGSPLYLLDETGIVNRFREFKRAVTSRYHHSVVALSYKTNPLHGLLARLHQEGAYAEVVSGDELEIARLLGVPDREIIFNGPMKTDAEIADALSNGVYLNCDNFDEVHRVENQARLLGKTAALGMRISFADKSNWSRFGFEVCDNEAGEAHECASYITSSKWLSLAGIHVQTGTNIRDVTHFFHVSRRVAEFAESLLRLHGTELEWIDLGGGLAGISPTTSEEGVEVHALPSVDEYAESAISPLHVYLGKLQHAPMLFFEPGRTIFEPFGGTLMTVVGERPSREVNVRGLIVDAGLNVLFRADEIRYPIFVPDTYCEQLQQTRIYGPSCRQRDVIRQNIALPALKTGDRIVMYGTGAYCMAGSHTFIRYRPGAVLWKENDDFAWLRKPDCLEHARQLEITTTD